MNRYKRKRLQEQMDKLKSEFTVKLTRQQIIMICNVLAANEDGSAKRYRIGDGNIVFGILDLLNPLVAEPILAPEPEEPKTENVIIGTEADKEEITN